MSSAVISNLFMSWFIQKCERPSAVFIRSSHESSTFWYPVTKTTKKAAIPAAPWCETASVLFKDFGRLRENSSSLFKMSAALLQYFFLCTCERRELKKSLEWRLLKYLNDWAVFLCCSTFHFPSGTRPKSSFTSFEGLFTSLFHTHWPLCHFINWTG